MNPFAHSKTRRLAAATLLLLSAAGCGRDSVKVYKIETNDTTVALSPAIARGAMPATMPAGVPVPDNRGLPALKYSLPVGWLEKPATQLRVASFGISENGKQADVSVIPLGGAAGGDFANVNRWRGQVGLAPVSEDELNRIGEIVEVAGEPASLYDIAGTSPGSGDVERIIATILHQGDTAWFFKMTGASDLVAKNKTAFIAFLKSVEFGGRAAPPTMDISQLPASHPAIPGMGLGNTSASAPEASGKPTWIVPAGWQEGPLAQFLVAKYVIPGAGDLKAEVNVSSLEGDGGGLLANVNRWRQQLGAAPITADEAAKFTTIESSGVKATVVEFSSTSPRTGKPAQLVGVVLPLGGQTWFYKLMGDAEVVAQQKEALIQFVQSAKYPAQ